MEPKKLGAAIAQILASQTGHKVDVHVRTISKGASLSSTINRNMHKQM